MIPYPAPVTPGPTLAPLSFSCQANFSPGSQLNISCSSSREISTLDIICFLDDIAQTDGCELYVHVNCFFDLLNQFLSPEL